MTQPNWFCWQQQVQQFNSLSY